MQKELDSLYPEIKRFDNPHQYIVDLSTSLFELKKELVNIKKEDLKE